MYVSKPRNRLWYRRFRAPCRLGGSIGESLVIPNYYKKFNKNFFSVNPAATFFAMQNLKPCFSPPDN
jgi:hypothetical protein